MVNPDEVSAAVEEGLLLFVGQQRAGKEVREQSRAVYGKLMDAHMFLMGVIGSSTKPMSGKPGIIEPTLAQLLSLTASFVQSIEICETAISEGYYVAAAALLKQEMETVAAISEVRNKRRRDGSTPNVKMFGEFAVVYGDLNKLAHVADSGLMQEVVRIEINENQSGAPLFPVFNAHKAKYFYGIHTVFLSRVAIEICLIIEELYGEQLSDVQTALLSASGKILQEEGWIKSG